MLVAQLVPGLLHQDPSHGLRSSSKEMPTAVPVLLSLDVTSRRWASWTRAVAPSVWSGDSAAIRAPPTCGARRKRAAEAAETAMRIALFNRLENLGDAGHVRLREF